MENDGQMSSPAMVDEPMFEGDRYVSRTEIREKLGASVAQFRVMENRPDWPLGVPIGGERSIEA
ncbi:hypothetical protein GCM10020255_008110 [Rhodococcus baikonurensis]